MNEQEIARQFRAGIYSIYAYIGRIPSQEEMQEYLQESWLRWLETTDESERANPRLCARRATSAAWMRERRHRLNVAQFVRNPPSRWAKGPLPEDLQAALLSLFRQARRRGGQRTEMAAQRDTQIIALLWQGWNDEGIAQEMGIPYQSVREYRKKIKRWLTNVATCGILKN